ncbi:BREX-1 system adenine-specific DNA-methyltransferase PglX [Haloarcula laminariae]|uniref:BREX-1 system adenine-specific DNA-methyltransferase PglX n=1 Tax=Haloarcula laminariae TaxID=2961577 RepID=UPI0021C7FC2D|nr:BREX-1 system adenine-specific DNA-methyltransferase PglX [Halomicroarcula laminariae]
MIERMPDKRNMSVRTTIEDLESIENGGDVIDYLLDSEGLNYSSFVEVPSGIKRNQGRNDWYEAHLVDESGDGVIRYIELEGSGDSPAFSDLKRQLKRHGSPVNELFTVIAYRKSDEGPLTSPLNDDLTFLYIEEQFSSEDVEVTFDLNYFTVKRFGVEPAYLDYLNDLTVESGQGRTSLEGDVEDVFSIREVTRSFYQDFGEIFREDLQDAIHGLEDPEENLNAYTRTVVNRVLFLLFIEEKGWLDGDIDYVENRYEEVAEEDNLHVYDDLFEPLFFEALSEEGTTESDRLGQIPFLNGGLFECKDIEKDVEIDETFFDKLLSPEDGDDGEPEGFLRKYKISLRESNPSEQELVVDPEFIGRIFEMFMQEDERSEVGAFYTPKPITAYMTKNALRQHLLGQTDISHEEAVSLVSDHTAPKSLSQDQITAVNNALRSATVLDPAVGSGAFIIGMLEELVAVSEALDENTDDARSRFQLKEEFIADTLYGVDIDAGGIELCKFRVWLHLMQDLDVDHEEFLDSNEEFALPNLGFKFFVGNSLVGEHDPTRVDVGTYQETLAGGLEATLEEIHTTRAVYQTAHGDKKDRLTDQLNDLINNLETQLAVKDKGGWMTDVAAEVDTTFAWTSNIPEVILNGGFDIVIGNPPYEGQSQQGYLTELAKFYDSKYDFYNRIDGMRYDLYQKFIIRGWELTREGGVLSYITSDTFRTIGSKQPTRDLLLSNDLENLVLANPDTFDAAVNPAIFTCTKVPSENDPTFEYIDASETGIEQYRSLVKSTLLRSDSEEVSKKQVIPINLSSSIQGYAVTSEIYKNTLKKSLFFPNETNLEIHSRFMSEVTALVEEWREEIYDTDALEDSLDTIRKKHITALDPGDTSIMGLLTYGGVGLVTGNNDEFLAYIEGSDAAERVKERNSDSFEYVEKNEEQYKWMSRVIKQDHILDPDKLNEEERLNGVNSNEYGNKVWVPYEKGSDKKDIYHKDIIIYLRWTKEALKRIKNNRNGRLRDPEYYFREGIFASRGGTGEYKVKARYVNDSVVDTSGVLMLPIDEKISPKYLLGILNSNFCKYILDNFINHTVNVQASDMRNLPIPIPEKSEQDALVSLVDEAIQVKRGEKETPFDKIQKKIDEQVQEIYGIKASYVAVQ